MPAAPALPAKQPGRRMLGPPTTQPGWWSLALAAAFVALFALFQILVATGQRGGETFFSNPWLSSTILPAAVSALAGGVAAALAIFRGERSLFVFMTLLLGLFVLLFSLGELVDPH